MSAIVRTTLTGGVAAAIILITGFLFARTEGFRSIVESQIAASTGQHVKIGESAALWNGDLVLGNIRTGNDNDEGAAGVRIESAHIDIDWFLLLRGDMELGIRKVSVNNWRVDFAPDKDGRLQPKELVAASDWLSKWGGLAIPPAMTSSRKTLSPKANLSQANSNAMTEIDLNRWRNTCISLRDGDITWWDGQGNIRVSVHEISFFLTPLDFPTRKAAHYHAKVKSAILPGDNRVRDMDVELLRTDDTYLVLNLKAIRQTPRSTSMFGRIKGSQSTPTEFIQPVTAAPPSKPPTVADIEPPSDKSDFPSDLFSYQHRIRSALEDALSDDNANKIERSARPRAKPSLSR